MHSASSAATSALQLLAVPALADNYIWLLHNGREALVCDPGEAAPVVATLQKHGLQLAAIAITHHHADHTAGVSQLYRQRATPGTRVYLPAADAISPAALAGVPSSAMVLCREGDVPRILELDWTVLDIPGHTAGHIAYYAGCQAGLNAPVLLCGDALFSGGCGRLFEGTPAQMYAALQKLAALPDGTRVCCGHEYTLSNLRFAQAVEPDNAALADYMRRCEALRRQGLPTLPSSLAQEKAINPFLRVQVPAVLQSVHRRDTSAIDSEQVFAVLRAWKDAF